MRLHFFGCCCIYHPPVSAVVYVISKVTGAERIIKEEFQSPKEFFGHIRLLMGCVSRRGTVRYQWVHVMISFIISFFSFIFFSYNKVKSKVQNITTYVFPIPIAQQKSNLWVTGLLLWRRGVVHFMVWEEGQLSWPFARSPRTSSDH